MDSAVPDPPGDSTDDPFAPISGAASKSGHEKAPEVWEPHFPAPCEPPAAEAIRHSRFGTASHRWVYRDATGAPLFAVVRFDIMAEDGQPGKKVLPYCFGKREWTTKAGNARKSTEWHFKRPAAPIPLYGLDRLAGRPGALILLCEGEKAADAAGLMFPDVVAFAAQGGSKAAGTSDWSSVLGRDVTIWPDADEAGIAFATTAVKLLRAAGAVFVRVVQISLTEWPEKWDLAAELPPGVRSTKLRALLEAAVVTPTSDEPTPSKHAAAGCDDDEEEDTSYWDGGRRPSGFSFTQEAKEKKEPRHDDWRNDWHYAETGSAIINLHNALVALRQCPDLIGIVSFDQMTLAIRLVRPVPFAPNDGTPFVPRYLTDEDVLLIQACIQMLDLRRIALGTVQDAVTVVAHENAQHPVRDHLSGLVWDQVPRFDTWLSAYLGAEDTPYTRAIGRLFLIACVARIFQPGCQADYMLILEGPQGAGKSSACRILAGGPQWFSDNLPDLGRADAVRLSMHLRGKWIIEIAELSSFNLAATHTLKEFLTQKDERYVPKYGRREVHEPRQCLFIGSTNEAVFLQDPSGARRFWPVKIGRILLALLARDRNQLFAEAVVAFRGGATWHPDPAFETKHMVPQQDARFEVDPWEETIAQWIEKGGGTGGKPDRNAGQVGSRPACVTNCTPTEVLEHALYFSSDQMSMVAKRRVSAILLRLGFVRLGRDNERRPFGKSKP